MRMLSVRVKIIMIRSYITTIINFLEWENAGECIAEGNQVLGTIAQTLSFKNYTEKRDEECYKKITKG